VAFKHVTREVWERCENKEKVLHTKEGSKISSA